MPIHIDISVALNELEHTPFYDKRDYETAKEMLKDMPTADVRENVHGEWVTEYGPDGKPYCLHCSVCDGDFSIIRIKTASNFCPNCGADMRKEKNEE